MTPEIGKIWLSVLNLLGRIVTDFGTFARYFM